MSHETIDWLYHHQGLIWLLGMGLAVLVSTITMIVIGNQFDQ